MRRRVCAFLPLGQEVCPVVKTMEVNARSKDVRVARETKRYGEAAVGTAPESDSLRIDCRQGLKIMRARENVVMLGSTAPACIWRVAEVVPIHDAQTVVLRADR